jgi:hypothetical protein
MVGVIWMVQLVVYPGFNEISPNRFVDFHAWYSRRISWIVGPAMMAELVTAVFAIRVVPAGRAKWAAVTGVLLVAALWIVTGWIQVPQHHRLSAGFDSETIADLVAGNWARVWLWNARVVVALILLWNWIRNRP